MTLRRLVPGLDAGQTWATPWGITVDMYDGEWNRRLFFSVCVPSYCLGLIKSEGGKDKAMLGGVLTLAHAVCLRLFATDSTFSHLT